MADEMMRDLQGYCHSRPLAQWPGAARLAVSFVLNYEEGGERNVLDGDAQAETYLVPEVVGLSPIAGRNPIVEDLFEYGSRAGFWRVLRLFEERGPPLCPKQIPKGKKEESLTSIMRAAWLFLSKGPHRFLPGGVTMRIFATRFGFDGAFHGSKR